MRIKLLSTMALGLSLCLGACTSDEIGNTTSDNEATVTFSVNIPKTIQSRSFSDGTQATNLYAILYRTTTSGGNTVDTFVKTMTATYNGGANFETRLIKDQAYKIVFWAQKGANAINAAGDAASTPASGEAPYTIDPKTGVVSMNYNTPAGNDETRDAFYAEYTISKVTDDESVNVTLSRPFAQLNFAASDFDSAKGAGMEYTKAAVKVDTYPSLDLINGSATGDLTSVTFAATAFPSDETFPNTDATDDTSYKYLSMNYFLVDQDASSTVDKVVLTLSDANNEAHNFEYTNIPVQKNYRTNVYGALLTNDFKVSVTLNAKFAGSYRNEYAEVSTAEELTAALSAGENITLTKDIEIESLDIPETGNVEDEPLQIELGGNTLTVTSEEPSNIKGDVTINGATTSRSRAGGARGKIVCNNLANGGSYAFMVNNTGNLTIENVELETKIGYGIFVASNGAKLTVNNCKIVCNGQGSPIGTNASTPYTAEITIDNSELHGYCGVFLNVPIKATITNSDLYGLCNGAMLRGGTYTITNTRFYLDLPAREKVLTGNRWTFDPNVTPNHSSNLEEKVWGSGTSTPITALCIGNRAATNATNASAYVYATTINNSLKDCHALIIPPTATSSILKVDNYANIYISANPDIDGVKNGVYLNFADTEMPKLTNDTYTTASSRGIVYSSANIFTLENGGCVKIGAASFA
jgi:phage gpG-like protein